MKKIILLFLALGLFFSCKEDAPEVSPEVLEFSLKGLDGEIIKSLPPDLLIAIHEDLIKKGRSKHAERLYELYDLNTGTLKGAEVNSSYHQESVQQMVDSLLIEAEDDTLESSHLRIQGQYAPHGVFAYCHIQDLGDRGPFSQANYLGADHPYPYAGTVGQGKRLEGMYLQTESSLFQTRPTMYYSLRNLDNTWTSTATWGQFTGTRGQKKAVTGLKIWIPNSSYSVWYKAHSELTGWNQPWHNNGQPAGISGRRLEAFAFHILKY